MPQGELFIRSKKTRLLTSGAAGLLATRPSGWPVASDGNGWVDAYLRYGLSLEDGALARLMAPAPNKKPTNIKLVGSHGVAYTGTTIGFKDEKTMSLDAHIVNEGKSDYLSKYGNLIDEVLDGGYFQVRISTQPSKVRHLLYDDCQISFMKLSRMAKMTLSVTEPHPEITDERVTGFNSIT